MKAIVMLVLSLFLDSDTRERVVVRESVDMVEKNHVYHKNDDGSWSPSFIQIIWWEYRRNILLPELDPLTGKRTGEWRLGSGYVVVDYEVYRHYTYKRDRDNKIMSPFLHRGKWVTIFFDDDENCTRIIEARQFRETKTKYDPEALNGEILEEDRRRELIKPRRVKKEKIQLPKEIEALLDMEIEL